MLRLEVSTDWYIANQQIQEETSTEAVEEMAEYRAGNLNMKMIEYENPLIKNLSRTRPTRKTDTSLSALPKKKWKIKKKRRAKEKEE